MGRPAKHLFGLYRTAQSSLAPSPQAVFQRRDLKPRRGPETLNSQPKGYPFKLQAALRSGRSPVFGGRAVGADAPNHSVGM